MRLCTFIIFLFSLLSLQAYCNNTTFNGYEFEKGEWELYIVTCEGTKDELKQLKNVYTNDKSSIQNLLSNLIISRDSISSGFSHYTQIIYVINNGRIVEKINLLNSLGKVNINDTYFNYDPMAFHKSTKKFTKIPYTKFTVKDHDIARKLKSFLDNQENILQLHYGDTLWTRFEGNLTFEAKFKSNVQPSNKDTVLKDAILDQIEDGKYYIEIPDSLDSPVSENELNYYDSISTSRNNIVREKIETELSIDSTKYELQFYFSSSTDDFKYDTKGYLFYSNEDIGKSFNSYSIIDEWKANHDIPFTIYGISYKEITKIIKNL